MPQVASRPKSRLASSPTASATKAQVICGLELAVGAVVEHRTGGLDGGGGVGEVVAEHLVDVGPAARLAGSRRPAWTTRRASSTASAAAVRSAATMAGRLVMAWSRPPSAKSFVVEGRLRQSVGVARHLTTDELTAALDHLRDALADVGRVELVVRRPSLGEREVLDEGALDLEEGLVGDNWTTRGSGRTADGSSPSRHAAQRDQRATVEPGRGRSATGERWPATSSTSTSTCSEDNLSPGTRPALGSAVIEVTEQPHTGCAKFVERFGRDAMRFVNSEVGRQLRLRGLNAKVVVAGTVRPGDEIRKV